MFASQAQAEAEDEESLENPNENTYVYGDCKIAFGSRGQHKRLSEIAIKSAK